MFKFTTKDNLSARMKLAPEKISRAISNTLIDIADEINEKAKNKSPYQTGTLRRGIQTVPTYSRGQVKKIEVGTSKIPYARIQDLGGKAGRKKSVKIRGKKYLTGQLDKMKKGRAEEILKKNLEEQLDV